jgi:putative transposase
MGAIKGKTSRKLLSEYRRLTEEFWGRHLWGREYFAASSGNVTDEMVMNTWHLKTSKSVSMMATSQ